jgi:betaine-aldehyde dehydrogenase
VTAVPAAPTRPLSPDRLLEPLDLVDGRWDAPARKLPDHLVDPATGEPLQQQVATAPDQVEHAVATAWRDHLARPEGIGTAAERAQALHSAAELIAERADDIAMQDAINSGVPISITRLFAGALADTFRAAASHLADLAPRDLTHDGRPVHLHLLPLGPAAVLAPWNAPTAVAGKKAAYAWAAGCPVIVKPSPWSPNGTRIIVEAMASAAEGTGLSRTSIQLVHGGADVGQQLAQHRHIRALSFTGSRPGGHAVAAAAADDLKALQLELGSNNPAVVLDDADPGRTAAALAAGMLKLNGAWCESPGTVYVPAGMLDALVAALCDEISTVRTGVPLDPDAAFGPQANPAQHSAFTGRLDRLRQAGARILSLGEVPDEGLWAAPTLVLDALENLTRDELFGPALVLRTYTDIDDVLAAVHELRTGLAAYVFSASTQRAIDIGRLLPAGEVKVNGTSLLDMSSESAQAFWYGSGIGGHGDRELALFFTGSRIVGQDVDSVL